MTSQRFLDLIIIIRWDRGILTDKTVPHNDPYVTIFEKTNRNNTVYLTGVSVPNVGIVQTAYTDKMRKYPALSPEVQQQWPAEVVYILPVAVSVSRATGLTGFAVRDHLTYKLYGLKVTDSTTQRYLMHLRY